MYYIYLLECNDKTIYTGITTDVDRRFNEHLSGERANYTRAHGAKKIIYTEEHKNRSEASKREVEIKKMTREEKLGFLNK